MPPVTGPGIAPAWLNLDLENMLAAVVRRAARDHAQRLGLSKHHAGRVGGLVADRLEDDLGSHGAELTDRIIEELRALGAPT
jgi:hypothetical protein